MIGVGINSNGITLILSAVIAGLLFPVLIFIGGATRLSAARREQRFAAMRLVGATPRQISVISTVESSVAAVVGVAAGFALFFALRPALAAIPFTGDPFFTSDLSLTLPDVLFIVLGIPIAAAVAARLALRRVSISPLGVTGRVTPAHRGPGGLSRCSPAWANSLTSPTYTTSAPTAVPRSTPRSRRSCPASC
ncbi:MAG: FtsX-like permease family protein [Jatrophihabitantaceae bacterium]